MCYYLTTPSIANIECRWQMNTEYGTLMEWYWQGKNPGTWIETCLRGVLCSSQNGLAWNRTRTLPMIDHRLAVGAMAHLAFLTTQNSLRDSWLPRQLGNRARKQLLSPLPPITRNAYGLWQFLDVTCNSIFTFDTAVYLACLQSVLRQCFRWAALSSGGGESGNYAGFSQKSHCTAYWLHHYLCVGLQWGSSPDKREKLVQGVCKVVLFSVRHSLALYMPINTYSQNGRSYRRLKRHIE